jgi:hypothetical protein
MAQCTNHIMLIRPARFGANAQTAATNAFQRLPGLNAAQIGQLALQEFDRFADALHQAGVAVHVFEDTPAPPKPDAIFPNNWISMHPNGTVVLYPMHTPNRMAERRMDIVEALRKDFDIAQVTDLYRPGGPVLEGTGSIVFDHAHRVAYACRSPRTDPSLLAQLCTQLQYRPLLFDALGPDGTAIYHTNVMLCIGEGFAVACLESIPDAAQRAMVTESLAQAGHTIVDISLAQMEKFAANMLQVKSKRGENILVLSQTAHDGLTQAQRQQLAGFAQLLPIAIPTIEAVGGGSARCMMAEVFLPAR